MSIDLEGMAYGILELIEENRALRSKVASLEKFKEAYFDEVNASRVHGEKMIAGILDLCLVPGVMEAVEANKP